MGSYYRLVIHPPPLLSHLSPTRDAPPLSSPGPVLPCPALLVPALWALAAVAKIPISRPRSGTQAKKAANLVHVCVGMCLYMCVPPYKVGLRLGGRCRGESIIGALSSLSITHIMAKWEWLINTFYCASRQDISLTSSVILRIDWLIILSTSVGEIGFISYFSPQTLFLLQCKCNNVARDLYPLPYFAS